MPWPGAVIALWSLLLASGCGRNQEPISASTVPDRTSLPKTGALNVGDPLPPLRAAGWINGPAPALDAPGMRLQVVDVWAAWCPFCRLTAPGLVRLHRKYADRGVAFLSITSMGREAAEAFGRQFQVPWPSGYGLPEAGAVPLAASSRMTTTG